MKKVLSDQTRKSKAGTTLIELMLSAIILAIIAIAGGAIIYLSRSALAVQRDKHAALTEAVRIMELARVTTGLRDTEGAFYEDDEGLILGSDPWEIEINGTPQTVTGMLTTTKISPYPDVTSNRQFTEISVSVDYKDGANVTLESIITDTD
jgi:Tfp pilus assembly protein PilX